MALFCVGGVAACASGKPVDWGAYDVLGRPIEPAPRRLGDVAVSDAEYVALLQMGESWFRHTTLGAERTITDVAGLYGAMIEIPCPPPAAAGCTQKVSAFPYFVAAIDALDGQAGNLYTGNGGPDGDGFTSDLVIRFPAGARLYGIPVPAELHTGLDVEAGEAWPIGIVPVAAAEDERSLPYLIDRAALGVGPSPDARKLRVGITCALCHYSLDIDQDGQPDLRSARWRPDDPAFNQRQVLPGRPYQPYHAWAVGNQDMHFGWFFGLTRNPMLGVTVLSGPVGVNDPASSLAWIRWVRDHYRSDRDAVLRAVVQGMLVQPRGYADDSPDAMHDPAQLPLLFTRMNWPYNYDGAVVNASDRNTSIWTAALDFTGLIGLAKDRSEAGQALLYWQPASVYTALPAETMADMMVRYSPAVEHDAARLETLKADILGTSDGVPGLLRSDSVVLIDGPQGALPRAVLDHPDNVANHRIRKPADYGADAPLRGGTLALLGTRMRTPPEMLAAPAVKAILERHPTLNPEELLSEAVSLMLDWNEPPPNTSALLAGAAPLVARGYAIFKREGCADCHRGPFFTDNRVFRFSRYRGHEIGIAAPSTAGWTPPRGPATETVPYRSVGTRNLQLFLAPAYDPATGRATSAGGPLVGLSGAKRVGYKTVILRHLWGSAPYLHDGGVGVSLAPGAAPAGDDLAALLARPASDKIFGMGRILTYREAHPETQLRASAALSLQALLLREERQRVIAGNRERVVPVPSTAEDPRAAVSMELLGVEGVGHDFYLGDRPGGSDVTALVAFLLALDDNPGQLPGRGP